MKTMRGVWWMGMACAVLGLLLCAGCGEAEGPLMDGSVVADAMSQMVPEAKEDGAQVLDWLMHSPLAQGMAGGLVLVVLLVLLKFVTKVVKVIVQLLILVTLVLLLVVGYFGWKNRKVVVDGAREAAERVKARATDGWKLVEPFVQRDVHTPARP